MNRLAPITIIETPSFLHDSKKHLGADERHELVSLLAYNPIKLKGVYHERQANYRKHERGGGHCARGNARRDISGSYPRLGGREIHSSWAWPVPGFFRGPLRAVATHPSQLGTRQEAARSGGQSLP